MILPEHDFALSSAGKIMVGEIIRVLRSPVVSWSHDRDTRTTAGLQKSIETYGPARDPVRRPAHNHAISFTPTSFNGKPKAPAVRTKPTPAACR
jgi:hypothetical protein